MTQDAVANVLNPFSLVSCAYSIRLMLVASEARIFLVVVTAVASRATRIVMFVQIKELAVIEFRSLPAVLVVASGAGGRLRTVEPVVRRCMACCAFVAYGRSQ